MPALAHGMPVVAHRTRRFDPELAFDVIARAGIRNVFMPATALRMMRRADGVPVSLRTIASGGETVGEETAAWCEERFGVRLNEFYGQTEANLLIGNCAAWPVRPGWMGRAYPGHELRLVDGEIAVRVEGDPVVFLGYWRDEAATAAKVRDGWLHTGDLAEVDDEGNFRSIGRVDDLISSGGYRIGPGEIEECLIRHPGRRDRGRDRRPRRGPRRDREGVRRHGCRCERVTGARGRAPGARSPPARALRRAAGDRVRRRAAADGDGQDPPRGAATAGAGASGDPAHLTTPPGRSPVGAPSRQTPAARDPDTADTLGRAGRIGIGRGVDVAGRDREGRGLRASPVRGARDPRGRGGRLPGR